MAENEREVIVRYGFIADGDDLAIAMQMAGEAALRKDATAAIDAVLRFAAKKKNMLKYRVSSTQTRNP